ncbi:hypothetical protein IMF22_08515 [Pseudomonas poae]|uniref:Uncharacterized protein n=1 Tax=Pseudomonas poae TaxID=200451 RepID=A0A7M1KLS5_9PSED|nr:hypothetical protein [Pseudomonas poae]QOQ77064.1 hypothetical protein IMF22_08515 [Pseudomonas poae]
MTTDKNSATDAAVDTEWHSYTLSRGASGLTGNLRIRWRRVANTLTVMTEEYMFTDNGSRNNANINFKAKSKSGAEWKVNSPDDRKQDGSWHVWRTEGSVALPAGAVQITFTSEFIFDMGGPDDRAIATHTVTV